jgi:hypothetical protein
VAFKTDEKTWGVTDINSRRMTAYSFGDYKSATRLEAEAKLTAYLCGFSEPRYAGGGDSFAIATAVAAPGTGKTRLLDDTVRGLIAADKSGDVLFDPSDKLLLAITFNGATTRACVHNVASRCVLEFFCCQPVIDDATLIASTDAVKNRGANDELDAIDAELSRLVRGPVATVEQAVLDALEALFFNARGSSLGRSVLLVDEISKADNHQRNVYRNVVEWVDDGAVRVAGRSGFHSRRGAVFTGLSVQTPWAQETASGRSVLRLALGLFDVWDPQMQDAILLDMRKRPSLPAAFWSLLASAGGRPRYREYCGGGEGSSYRQGQPRCPVAIAEQSDLGLYVVFRRYLLPSLLNVQFLVHDGTNPTQFGLDVTSRALCNSDLLATTGSNAPSLSLRFFTCLKGQLQSVFERLVRATTFCELRGDGKDFENAWVLLLQTHLLLLSGADISALVALSEVEWKSPALVYFTQKNNEAIDFLLLVGEMGGSGATEPHVCMFLCKARTRDSVAAAGLQEIVDKLDAKLDKLFSRAYEGNVLRVAGINSKKQVTLCVAALQIGD